MCVFKILKLLEFCEGVVQVFYLVPETDSALSCFLQATQQVGCSTAHVEW